MKEKLKKDKTGPQMVRKGGMIRYVFRALAFLGVMAASVAGAEDVAFCVGKLGDGAKGFDIGFSGLQVCSRRTYDER